MADKAGPNEFRCDMLETKEAEGSTVGVCEVSLGTPAGYYNFTYVLENSISGAGEGMGRSLRGSPGHRRRYSLSLPFHRPKVNFHGQPYDVEVYPTVHGISRHQGGRLGGSEISLTVDALEPGRGSFAERHTVLLDGVHCVPQNLTRAHNLQKLTCVTEPLDTRPCGAQRLLSQKRRSQDWTSKWRAQVPDSWLIPA